MGRTIEAAGQEYPWDVDDRGYFSTKVGNHELSAKTLEELTEKARASASKQKVRVAIPVAVIVRSWKGDAGHIRNATLTGRNAGNGQVTLRWQDDNKAEQIDSHTDVLQPLSPEELDEIVKLRGAVREATQALEEYLAARSYAIEGKGGMQRRHATINTLNAGQVVDHFIGLEIEKQTGKIAGGQ